MTHGHEQEYSFLQRLEFVAVKSCEGICTLFPTKLRQGLRNLRSVKIKGWESLEEVFELSAEKELPLLSSLTELQLRGLPELKCIWKGPTGHLSLQNLARLDLWSLDKLAFIFTPSLAQSLPKLERLEIRDCGELKHIIREEDGEREIIPESPRFPKLKTLRISQCGKLEYVFPISVSLTFQSLPQLQTLETRDCRELEHIIREKDGENNCHKMVTVLPNLQELSLKELPSIFRFSQGCFEFLFPRLETLSLSKCPKLTTKFAITPDRLMSAQSEVLLI